MPLTIPAVTPKITYTVGGTPTTVFAYNFPIFADADLKVYVGGVLKTLTTDYTVSGAGQTAGGNVTLLVAVSNTTVIIERAVVTDRTTDFPESGRLDTASLNTQLDKLFAILQQMQENINRCLQAPTTDGTNPAQLPAKATRASMSLVFNANGDPIAGSAIGNTTVSAAIIPFVTAVSLAAAKTQLGLGTLADQNANAVAITGGTISGLSPPLPEASGGTARTSFPSLTWERSAKIAAYTVVNGDKGKTIALGGAAFYQVTIGAASGFDANFAVRLVNEDTGRGKRIAPNGITSFILWPGQTVVLYNANNVWKLDKQYERWKAVPTLWCNPAGLDTNDGLTSGAANGFLTIQRAVDVALYEIDTGSSSPVIIQLEDGTYQPFSVIADGVGSNQIEVRGNPGAPQNVAITRSTAGDLVYAKDKGILTISGVKLVPSVNGCTGLSAAQMAVIDFSNIIFDAMTNGNHITCLDHAKINALGAYYIQGGAVTHFNAQQTGSIFAGNPMTVTISFGPLFTYFALASSLGYIHTGGVITYSGAVNGATQKYLSQLNSVINSGGTTFPGGVAGATATGGQYV